MKQLTQSHDANFLREPSRTRRRVVALTGAAAAITLAGRAGALSAGSAVSANLPACALTPEQTEGPYFVDEHLNRSDIRSDPATGLLRPGVPMTLALRVHAIARGACSPLTGATVDLWPCDAEGRYSDVADRRSKAAAEKFLRGYQVTDQSGAVRFSTVYPGWYPGRAVHIHFKVRTHNGSGRAVEFTSQLYFDEAITDRVFAQAPYSRAGHRSANDDDGIFGDGGRQLLLTPRVLAGRDRGNDVYAAEFDVGVRTA